MASTSLAITVETDLGKVGHAFVVGAEKLKAAIIDAENALKNNSAAISNVESIAASVVETVYPGSATVVAAIQAVMARVFNAVDSMGEAAAANGLSISLDETAVAAVKAALPTVKTQATTTPGA